MATDRDFQLDNATKEILSSLDHGVAVFDKDRVLLFANPAMKRVTGDRNGVGSSLSELIQKHQLRSQDGSVVNVHDFPVERAFRGEETRDAQFEYIAPDGSHVWLSVTCAIISDETGATKFVVTSVRNISERKSREDKLHFMVESAKILSITQDFRERLREKARLTVPTLADWCAIDILDQDGAIERAVLFHRDPKMIQHVYAYEKKYPIKLGDPHAARDVINSVQSQFVPSVTDEMLVHAAKSPEQLEALRKLQLRSLMTIPIDSRGKGLGAMTLAYAESGRTYTEEDLKFFEDFCHHMGVLLDNAKLYEEITSRDKAKDLFLASLSHELRNPLAPIKSSLELLAMKGTPPEIRQEIEVIEHQFDHMTKLLHDLLDVTRFTSGKIAISPVKIDLLAIIQRALKATEPLVRNAYITLETQFSPGPVCVEVDETRIEQAVMNLIANASKFTPAGGTISVSVHADTSFAYIEIKDTGVGIAETDLAKIFDMYYQGSHGTGINSGLGIGLPLVKSIIELHGGEVTATSAGLGLGSTFTLRIPLTSAPAVQAQVSDPTESYVGRRVLIVDDNMPAADSLAKLLNRIGMLASACYSGRDALASDARLSADVILLDIGMPEMDGYEVVRNLRAEGIVNPIVALTGYGLADDKLKAQQAGFTAHLTKPTGLKEIRELFAEILP